ncbi:SDR family oxidoreductase [Siphonobacter aquaeclarae]|uniref:NAD(P)-dependent dehydrogenase, short-chain alcohol dehydrogenase family n=1 Tax=Siphonobacter aquaeclarae TaxID=563176 RepID=A0A1G9R0D9_9BACT|nr:SDR family oxidoreductase [Siphonobacter aquaeclarae]SDM16708.1 NAD(P)-dependent dehydrogenase, short-chain alcohol dehydrogenase family [Siphonobacter aquaeclarae]
MPNILLITGSSEGIGAEAARLAALRGYTVCVNYRSNQAGAETVVADIQKAGGQAYVFQADVADEAQVFRLFRQIDEEVGPLSALVNNAGIIESQSRLVDMSAERLTNMFAVNTIGAFLCAREAVKRMSTARGGAGGAIVNVSSMAAKHGSPFEYIDYAATKAALDTMTLGLSKEVGPEGIRVNAVRPGIILTDIHAKAGEPGRPERVRDTIPLKRPGTAPEVANAILWLLSDEASFVNGALLDVTGGR